MKEKQFLNINIPTFFKSFASAFDISGQTLLDFPDFHAGFQKDREALKGDWFQIGSDIKRATTKYMYEQR